MGFSSYPLVRREIFVPIHGKGSPTHPTAQVMKTRYLGLITSTLLAGGCTHFTQQRFKARAELDEHSRTLTTAVVDTLQSATNRDARAEFALRLAREDQRIEGLPQEPINVARMTQLNEQRIEKQFARIEKLIAREQRSEARLLELGTQQEEDRNRSRSRWAKWLSGGSLLIGGLIALGVFVPASLPILGRVLGWLAGKIPAAAGALGVVSVKAFDAVVRGIERSKPNADHFANEPAGSSLELNLSREMDASHKDLVRARKTAIR